MSEKFKAVVIDNINEKFSRDIKEISLDELKDGNVLIKIDFSSLNYKDALILNNGGKIVKKFFNIDLKKTETNSNWLKRPLTDNQINYALDDVDFLIEIYNFQRKMLIRSGKLQHVLKESENEAFLGNQSLKILRFKKKEKKFSNRSKKIFMWREEIAEKENIPPTFIFKDKFIQKLSKIDPNDNHARNKIMTIIGDTELTNRFIDNFL